MHPAFSIIVFTCATGAGYGLLALVGTLSAVGMLPPDRMLIATALSLAVALIIFGLSASTAHLGRPERAWRAFSQWRSSWLSREAIASLFTFVPTGLFGIGRVLLDRDDALTVAAGLVMATSAAVTVFTTGMIYACLKPIAQWSSPLTTPAYLILAVMTGAVLLDAVAALNGTVDLRLESLTLIAIGLGWTWKQATWRYNDRLAAASTANSATGLAGGSVRSIEWPHTQENYVLKEMGYRVARKHAAKLRLIAQCLAFAIPFAAIATALVAASGAGKIASVVAALAQAPGIMLERWLFFAEARHTVALYYGLDGNGNT
jgi:DMSO reductase anchor subunit